MAWETKSEIMEGFLKIASEQGLLKESYPQNPYQEDKKTIEGKRLKTPEKSIIEVAHPEKVYVAEARGDGGLVENQIQQQKKIIELLNKMPTGSLVGRYASTVVSLVKLANQCEDLGHSEAAELLTTAAQSFVGLLEQHKLPLA